MSNVRKIVTTLCFICFFLQTVKSQEIIHIKGIVVDKDSVTPVPFAYALNRVSNKGIVILADGTFEMDVRYNDSLLFSHLGYKPYKLRVSDYAHKIHNNSLSIKIIFSAKSYALNEMTIRSGEFTVNEKKYYENILHSIPKYTITSPITTLYYEFSKKGKSLKKLGALYNNLLLEEAVQKKLNDEVLRKITGDPKITLQIFREYCKLSDFFILSSNDYELFEAVSMCYKEHTEYYISK